MKSCLTKEYIFGILNGFILLYSTTGIEAFSLEFNPPLVIGEPLCPMDILMTCKAVNVGPLRWFAVIDHDNTCMFAEHDSDRYDFCSTCLPGVSENYTSVRVNAPIFDINTTLNINLISLAPVMGVYCDNKTNIIDVDIKIQGPPPQPIINSCCSGDHEVPVNSAKCSIVTSTSEVTLYFEWSLQYTSVNRVESYRVRTCSFNDSFPECSTPVVVNSNVNFTVTLPIDHCVYISATNCGNLESEYTRLNVPSNGPLDLADMLSVNYTATYSEDGRLMEIDVEWEDVMDNFECDVNTTYEVELRTNRSLESITRNTESCSNNVCLVIFPDLMDKRTESFEVRVVASNQFINETEVYTSSVTIMSNIMDIIEKNGCNLSIRCPTSFNGKCVVLNDLEDSNSSEVVQLSNITLSISRQKIPLEVITFNDSTRVILKYNYTTDIKDNRAVIGAGVAAFIFGFILLALGCIVAFTARFFKSCPCLIMTKDDYRCCWIATLAYSAVIILLFIALLILWIIVSTAAHSDSCPTGQPYLEIIAMSLSFVLVVVSTIMLATFILLILLKSKNKQEESYEIEEMTYTFDFGTVEVTPSLIKEACKDCSKKPAKATIVNVCFSCGKYLCKDCSNTMAFLKFWLEKRKVCIECNAKYWEQNKHLDFEDENRIREISKSICKTEDICRECENYPKGSWWSKKTLISCSSCGKMVCSIGPCHNNKMPLHGKEEQLVCKTCYALYKRWQHVKENKKTAIVDTTEIGESSRSQESQNQITDPTAYQEKDEQNHEDASDDSSDVLEQNNE